MSQTSDPDLPEHATLEHSPLEREVERDGERVRICIYRSEHKELGWILEVEHQDGSSTVWDDPFDSDQAALDEALRSIDEDGLESFANVAAEARGNRQQWLDSLALPPLSEIEHALDSSPQTMSFHATCGVFAAVATAPEMVRSSAWLDLIKGEHVFQSLDEVGKFTSGIMALYNEVLRSVAERSAHCCPEPSDVDAVSEFCKGYLEVALNDPTWEANERAFVELLPIMALAGATTMEKVGELLPSAKLDPEDWLRRARAALPETITGLYEFWRPRRATPTQDFGQGASLRRESAKVGRNDPCPCGSGKKFKKCCAN